MNEVTKLYENAGFLKKQCKDYSCIVCDKNKDCNKYPPFTAEKQLELIKWLGYKMHITIGKGLPWGQYDDDWWTVTSKNGYSGMNAYRLEEALAQIVNVMWQDLTEEERKQIKEILE